MAYLDDFLLSNFLSDEDYIAIRPITLGKYIYTGKVGKLDFLVYKKYATWRIVRIDFLATPTIVITIADEED